ncbi:MAG: helix-turn-helix transcriptional regulator [Clostridia bacterium]|nr:helix-turn-helix transcriptional regulator [Clostridia bacterium]
MKAIDLNDLIKQNFNIEFINSLKQFWHTTKSFQCLDNPKKQNLFLYVDGCKITYTDKTGKVVTANSGDVVYTPIGSEYRAQLYDFKDEKSSTIGINFMLLDENGESLILSNDILVFTCVSHVKNLFKQSLEVGHLSNYLKNRITLLEILSNLSFNKEKDVPPIVLNAVKYLEENIEKNPTIYDLAKVCNVSEVYLRKQFKESLNKSPVQFRNELRLKKSKTYLEYGDISVQEISDTLGYATVSHFIKEFKTYYGFSPLKYRKKIKTTV